MEEERGQFHGGSITIGLRELYAQMKAIEIVVTTMSAKVDMAIQQQNLTQQSFAQQLADIRHDLNDHETRLRIRESQNFVSARSMWTALGVIIPIVGIVITIIGLTIR